MRRITPWRRRSSRYLPGNERVTKGRPALRHTDAGHQRATSITSPPFLRRVALWCGCSSKISYVNQDASTRSRSMRSSLILARAARPSRRSAPVSTTWPRYYSNSQARERRASTENPARPSSAPAHLGYSEEARSVSLQLGGDRASDLVSVPPRTSTSCCCATASPRYTSSTSTSTVSVRCSWSKPGQGHHRGQTGTGPDPQLDPHREVAR